MNARTGSRSDVRVHVGVEILGWCSFAIVLAVIPLSAILFTPAASLSQFCLISAGIAAAGRAFLPAFLTIIVYTLTSIYVTPSFFFEVFADTTNRGLPLVIFFVLLNYGAFNIGLGIGIYKRWMLRSY